MVEGGARVIGSFLSAGTVDAVIVTIAPRFVGEDGTGYRSEDGLKLRYICSELMGDDTVVGFRLQR
jgi:2,5-diamino-6-(ribosylamino)-4(3H)-pyrimidinone 5'-phosphate reductase